MANNKVQLADGTTLIDLTGTTATADKILEGYGAFGADGVWMDGVAVAGAGSVITVTDTVDENGGIIRNINAVSLEGDTVRPDVLLSGYTAHNSLGQPITGTATSGGSGPDYPVFTVVANANTGEFTSITCDKTFSECLSIANNGMLMAVASMSAQGSSPINIGFTVGDALSNEITYFADSHGIPAMQITYTYHGDLSIISPPSSVTSLTATHNGTYSAEDEVWTEVTVSVPTPEPSLQTKSATPSETAQTITPDIGYDGLNSVSVGAISSTYVGSGITRRSSSDLTASGATVTVPAGYYESQGSKSVASGTATAPTSISGTTATVSTGTNTLTLSKTVSVTPRITTAGYISSGTAGNSSVSLTASVTTRAAATITPTKSVQTIASGTYLTGTQTIAAIPSAYQDVTGVTATASDVVNGKDIVNSSGTVVHGSLVIQHYYTGSGAPSSSTGVDGDIYLQTS